MREWARKMTQAMAGDPHFADVNNDLQDGAIQVTLNVDKDKAASLGINADQIRSTLYSGFGSRQVSTIYGSGDSFSVLMEFDPKINWNTGGSRKYPHPHGGRPACSAKRVRDDPAHRRRSHRQPAGPAARR